MKHAAKEKRIFHLWWHPEDFALRSGANLEFLQRVLQTFDECRREYGMVSLSMGDMTRRWARADDDYVRGGAMSALSEFRAAGLHTAERAPCAVRPRLLYLVTRAEHGGAQAHVLDLALGCANNSR